MSDHAVPTTIQGLVHTWRADDSPVQPGIAWPRERWVTALPGFADTLAALPERLDRETVRRACVGAADDKDAAARAFVTVMTWGFGDVGYGPHRTRTILNDTPDATQRLATAARTLADDGPLAGCREPMTHGSPGWGQPSGRSTSTSVSPDQPRRWRSFSTTWSRSGWTAR